MNNDTQQYTEDITNDEWMRYAHEAGALKEQCIAEWVREVEASLLTEKEGEKCRGYVVSFMG